VPIRVLFRLSEAKPACTGATLRVRAEALEHGEAPAGLARGRSCGLMEIENLFRYTALAVGLKPSASQGEARLHGRNVARAG
jgi:hypothetical protein